jgi:hypothetical protein
MVEQHGRAFAMQYTQSHASHFQSLHLRIRFDDFDKNRHSMVEQHRLAPRSAMQRLALAERFDDDADSGGHIDSLYFNAKHIAFFGDLLAPYVASDDADGALTLLPRLRRLGLQLGGFHHSV